MNEQADTHRLRRDPQEARDRVRRRFIASTAGTSGLFSSGFGAAGGGFPTPVSPCRKVDRDRLALRRF